MGQFGVVRAALVETRAYVAAEPAAKSGVVVLHAWWGLNADVTAFTHRLADAGYAVIAPDLYGGDVVDTVEAAEARVATFDGAAAVAILRASLDDLAQRLGPGARLAVLGFSLGASVAVAAAHPSLAGIVLYYGTGDPADASGTTPVLGHFAESDPYEEAAWVEQFEGQLRAAGHEVTFHRYKGVGHWFAEPSRDAYRPEAADLAFQRTLAFLARTLRPA